MIQKAVILNAKDNVATALADLKDGDTLELKAGEEDLTLKLTDPVPFGHKFSLNHISLNENIIKYGEIIGRATKDIAPGAHVHTHNVDGIRARGDLKRRTA